MQVTNNKIVIIPWKINAKHTVVNIVYLVDCGGLSSPTNGQVSFTTTTFGSMVSYTCNSGYMLEGGIQSRSCQAEGLWSGNDRTCARTNYEDYNL